MRPEDVERLRARRLRLQARFARQKEAAEFRELAPRLRAAGVRRLSRMPSPRLREVSAQALHLPGRDERFYWPEIPAGHCVGWRDEAERDAAFVRALRACFAPDTRLLCIFTPWRSALVLGCSDAIAHANLLMEHGGWRLWLIPRSGGPGLVEVSHSDDEVCWLPPPTE